MRRVSSLLFTGLLAPAMLLCLPAQAQEKLPYRKPALPVEQRVADLLGRMTREEKIAQFGGTWQNRSIEHDKTQFLVGKNRPTVLPSCSRMDWEQCHASAKIAALARWRLWQLIALVH